MKAIVEIGRETSGMDSGDIVYCVKVGAVADLSPNDLGDLLAAIDGARESVLRSAQPVDRGAIS